MAAFASMGAALVVAMTIVSSTEVALVVSMLPAALDPVMEAAGEMSIGGSSAKTLGAAPCRAHGAISAPVETPFDSVAGSIEFQGQAKVARCRGQEREKVELAVDDASTSVQMKVGAACSLDLDASVEPLPLGPIGPFVSSNTRGVSSLRGERAREAGEDEHRGEGGASASFPRTV